MNFFLLKKLYIVVNFPWSTNQIKVILIKGFSSQKKKLGFIMVLKIRLDKESKVSSSQFFGPKGIKSIIESVTS